MGKFEVKTTKAGVRFALKAGNGETIAVSEIYSGERACLSGIESMRKNAPAAAIEDQTKADYTPEKHPKFEVYADKAGEYRFRLRAKNGEIIASSESYKAKASCLGGVDSVKKNAPDAQIVKE